MKRVRLPFLSVLFPLIFFVCLEASARPQAAGDLTEELRALIETPAIPGYERDLAKKIQLSLARFAPKRDSLGNVTITIGSGEPHRLLVAPMDEPGYVVSGITGDGYLRVQRLPQLPPNPLFDSLYAAQPVLIQTRAGKWVNGVVAGLSIHLQPGRRDAPAVTHPDQIYVDIGADSAAEARRAGVDLLDPLVLDRQMYELGTGKLTAPAIGDRFGAAALVELARGIDPAKLKGSLTIAFVARQWVGARGLQRLLESQKPDEMIFIGRLQPERAPGARVGGRPQLRRALREPGGGVLLGVPEPQTPLAGFAAEIKELARANQIPLAQDFSASVMPKSYLPEPPLPNRFVHLSVATAWPATPAEMIDLRDVQELVALLQAYAVGSVQPESAEAPELLVPPPSPSLRRAAPRAGDILQSLVETYGVSGHEAAVRDAVKRLLPPWAKPETDDAGNLLLHWAAAPSSGRVPRLVFVAHLDEIGFEVRSIAGDGRLLVTGRGRSRIQFYAGHAAFVHTASGIRPGVMELPPGWQEAGFNWPVGESTFRVDVGARTPMEAERLGVKAGDWVTVPKKYRRLAGKRASGRSFDDRVGCTALIAAGWALGASGTGRDVTFVWSTEEELDLQGAAALAQRLANDGRVPDTVFAVDTFVSSDSPLESKRFADARLGMGFVVRAVDNSNIVPLELVDRVVRLARASNLPVQTGVTGGGNDGSAFLRYGAIDVALGWPLRYSHSPGEVLDMRDVVSLAGIVAALARGW